MAEAPALKYCLQLKTKGRGVVAMFGSGGRQLTRRGRRHRGGVVLAIVQRRGIWRGLIRRLCWLPPWLGPWFALYLSQAL